MPSCSAVIRLSLRLDSSSVWRSLVRAFCSWGLRAWAAFGLLGLLGELGLV